jgi:hypothetical protein
MIPMWLAFALHVLGLLIGAMCHALATRNRRATTLTVDAPQLRRWVASKPQIRVATTTIREEKR